MGWGVKVSSDYIDAFSSPLAEGHEGAVPN